MAFSIVGILTVIAGIIVVAFAERLSLLERRIVDKHPNTRVTGWSGTKKGTRAWRLVGMLLIFVGAIQQLLTFIAPT